MVRRFVFQPPFRHFLGKRYNNRHAGKYYPYDVLNDAVLEMLRWCEFVHVSLEITEIGWFSNMAYGKKLTFYNLRFSEDQKKELKQFALTPDGFATELVETLAEGYRLGISYDPDQDLYHATIVQRDDRGTNAGKMLTYRHADALRVMLGIVYGHSVLLKGDWAAMSESAADDW